MPLELVGANVVVVAQQFNPSVFSQLWLVKNHILEEGDFRDGCLFSDDVAKIESRQFGLLVVPPQLQFRPTLSDEGESDIVAGVVGRIVRTIPHTPYKAIGLNFVWHVWSDDGDMHQLSRSLFFASNSSLLSDFADAKDVMFGGYASRDFGECRLRLDMKPIFNQVNGEPEGRMQFSFNFQVDHLDSPDVEAVSVMERHLQSWCELREESNRIVSLSLE